MRVDDLFDEPDDAGLDPADGEPAADGFDLDVGDLEPPAPRVDGRPSHLSPSSATMFQQCARRWKLRYVDRLADPPGEAALAGTFAHRVLELLLQEPPSLRTEDRAKELARVAWPEIAEHPDFVALALSETDARAFRWKGWLAVKGLWHLEDPRDVLVEATEQDLRVHLGDVPFRGIIDRLDVAEDGIVVTDYKSGRAPSPRFADTKASQVLLYAAAVTELTGQQPVRARLLYLGQRVVDIAVTPDNLAATVAALDTTWQELLTALETQEFAPRTGPLCAWCPFVAQCPEGAAEVRFRHAAGRVRPDAPALVALPAAS